MRYLNEIIEDGFCNIFYSPSFMLGTCRVLYNTTHPRQALPFTAAKFNVEVLLLPAMNFGSTRTSKRARKDFLWSGDVTIPNTPINGYDSRKDSTFQTGSQQPTRGESCLVPASEDLLWCNATKILTRLYFNFLLRQLGLLVLYRINPNEPNQNTCNRVRQ